MNPQYPVIHLMDEFVMVYRSHEEFLHMASRVTDKALRDGFVERSVLVDSSLIGFQLEGLELEGRSGFFGWLKPRRVSSCRFKAGSAYDLAQLKALVVAALHAGEADDEIRDVVASVETAVRFADVVEVLK